MKKVHYTVIRSKKDAIFINYINGKCEAIIFAEDLTLDEIYEHLEAWQFESTSQDFEHTQEVFKAEKNVDLRRTMDRLTRELHLVHSCYYDPNQMRVDSERLN